MQENSIESFNPKVPQGKRCTVYSDASTGFCSASIAYIIEPYDGKEDSITVSERVELLGQSINELEALSISRALERCIQEGYTDVEVLTDSLNAIRIFLKDTIGSGKKIRKAIYSSMDMLRFLRITKVRRGCLMAVDKLAGEARCIV